MKIGILKSFRNHYKYIIKACEKLGVDNEVIDIIGNDWLQEIQRSDCDGFICRPPSKFQERKSMFDERLYMMNKMMGKIIYPSYDELLIYENKKMMAYWLELNGFPHAKTDVFYNKKECIDFLKNATYPLVFKTNIGSTAKGVKIFKSYSHVKPIINKIFGVKNSKLAKGYTPQTSGKMIPIPARGCNQKHYALFQEFLEIKWEWRIIKIGKSYFGHKKLLKGDFASGSGLVGWEKPPKELLLMIKDLCEKGNFDTMDMDVFETLDGKYYINELQSIFGSFQNYQMKIDDIPGRYIYNNGEFVFEEGEFNILQSNYLRVEDFVEKLKNGYYIKH